MMCSAPPERSPCSCCGCCCCGCSGTAHAVAHSPEAGTCLLRWVPLQTTKGGSRGEAMGAAKLSGFVRAVCGGSCGCVAGCSSWRLARTDESKPGGRRMPRGPSCGGRGDADAAPLELLNVILAIERKCFPEANSPFDLGVAKDCASSSTSAVPCDGKAPPLDEVAGLEIQVLADEPRMRFVVCYAPDSSDVIIMFCIREPDLQIEDVWRALADHTERAEWDKNSESVVLRRAAEGDPMRQEVVHLWLHPPWPFWTRDVLKHQWELPLHTPHGRGFAFVSRSFEDEEILPEHSGRVRAFVHKAASLVRPTASDGAADREAAAECRGTTEPSSSFWWGSAGDAAGCEAPALKPLTGPLGLKGKGVQLTNCTQINLGGLIPNSAIPLLSSFAVAQATAWSTALREHCLRKGRLCRDGAAAASLCPVEAPELPREQHGLLAAHNEPRPSTAAEEAESCEDQGWLWSFTKDLW